MLEWFILPDGGMGRAKVMFSVAVEGNLELSEYEELLRIAEGRGFYSFQIYDHLPYSPAAMMCSKLVSASRRILIGPVTLPLFLYHPVTIARIAGFLSHSTGGRTIIGVSRGGCPEYFVKSINRSLSYTVESLKLIEKLLRGERVFLGEFHDLRIKEPLSWSPWKGGEFYVGTAGPKLALESSKLKMVTGITVDGVWDHKHLFTLKKSIDEGVKMGEKQAGSVKLALRPFTVLSEDLSNAEERCLNILRQYARHLMRGSGLITRDADAIWLRAHIKEFCCYGDADKILSEISRIATTGVEHICFGLVGPEDVDEQVERLGDEIVKRFPGED